MQGNLEVLDRGAARDPELLAESLSDMRREVARLIRMANDLLLLAQSEAGVQLRDEGSPEVTVMRVGDLSLDLRTRRAEVDGATVTLTAREFTMLEMFLRHPDQVLSREQLLSHVWGYDYDPGSNVVDVYVAYLRRKLGKHRFETVRGMGYRMVG